MDQDSDHGRDVQLVLAFLNTLDIESGTDVLLDEAAWLTWARRQEVPEPGSRAQARLVRDALRATAGVGLINDRRLAGALQVDLVNGQPVLVGSDAAGVVLAASARLAVLGDWERVKICAAAECRWAFFDRSRNRSRTWCSMRVCGNRTKARNWRERARVGANRVAVAP
ncbi:MAG TPA: CGNR zinc finger domain-containing protein [Pseudonocardiaceae bacterium]|nr:CGNR zinc finger domain-containing protein [Pseudonocardiaceae bacterium]